MNILTVAICEDSKYDVSYLQEEIRALYPTAEIHLYENGDTLVEKLDGGEYLYNVVFLGLHEPGLHGLKIAQKIREREIDTPLIFVSDTDGYYKEAFDVFAVQYFELPLDSERFAQTFQYLKRWESKMAGGKTIHFRYRSQLYSIHHSRIIYISSNLHNVQFHLVNGRTILCRGKLNDFEDQLRDSTFLRCHQSFYVNMEKVISMRNDSFLLGDAIVPISRSCANEAKQTYTEFLESKGTEF